MSNPVPADAARSLAAALIWDEALDDLTVQEVRDLVERVALRLFADGWQAPSRAIPWWPIQEFPEGTLSPCYGCSFPCGNVACPQRTIITYATDTVGET